MKKMSRQMTVQLQASEAEEEILMQKLQNISG